LKKRNCPTAPLGDIKPASNFRSGAYKVGFVKSLFIASWIAAVFSLAGPRNGKVFEKRLSEGVDIMIALDVSGSMGSVDVPPTFYQGMEGVIYNDEKGTLTNRLTYAKMFTKDFIMKRKDDRIGLVVFAGYSFTRSPLTFDHSMLLSLLDQISFSDVNVPATAIGLAIANSVQRLIKSKAKSRVIILITDGSNNAGEIDPTTAASIAKTMGVKVYTIGVGSDTPLFPRGPKGLYVKSQFVLDEATLLNIAKETGAVYFRVKDPKTLNEIYARIDTLEKSRIEKRVFVEYHELFQPFLLAAIFMILLAVLFRTVFFRIYP